MPSDTISCPQCGRPNEAGAGFCSSCGASLSPQAQCPSCNTLNPVGHRFCTRCGGSLEHAGWAGPPAESGGVVEGVWERGGDEIIRRVDPEDARRFLGTRTVRVPAGTVGVILVDGVVERVLPPGERTSLGVFERIANFFLRRDRTAFYLVDQRPFPVPFVVRTRPSQSGRTVKSQVLATFTLPRGDRDALARFIANVLGPRPAFTTGDLYNLLRPDVVRVAQETLERAAATGDGDISYPDAEAAIRRALADVVGPRYGLTVDATLAPLTATASLSLRLGTGPAPKVRSCVKCRHEIPVSMRFCDACGAKQPEVVSANEAPTTASPLFTLDGQQVELDLVVRVQGQHDDFTPERIAPALVAAAAAHLRGTTFAQVAAAGGFAALETDIGKAAADALESFGLTLVGLSVVDARTRTGEWLLSARADLERARADVHLGLSWLEQRDAELDLEELTVTRVLREQKISRDQAFARDDAAVADKERRDGLAERQATLEVAETRRRGATQTVADDVTHDRQRREAERQIELRKTRVEAELGELRARRDLDLEDIEKRKKLELELARIAEEQQLAKLRGMAEIERETAAQEHAHEVEKRRMMQGLSPDEMIALQAAELARSEGGGAAWANVLAQKASAEAERRHAEESRGIYDKAMGAMADVARSRAEAAPVVAGGGAPVVTVASTGEASTRKCKSCGAGLKSEARFCGACGTSQV